MGGERIHRNYPKIDFLKGLSIVRQILFLMGVRGRGLYFCRGNLSSEKKTALNQR